MTVWIGKITGLDRTASQATIQPDATQHGVAAPVTFVYGDGYQQNGLDDALRSQAMVVVNLDANDVPVIKYMAYPNVFGTPPNIPNVPYLPPVNND